MEKRNLEYSRQWRNYIQVVGIPEDGVDVRKRNGEMESVISITEDCSKFETRFKHSKKTNQSSRNNRL